MRQFWQYLKNIAYILFCADITRLLQYFKNISDWFRKILATLQYFQGIFLQYFLNISVLCGILFFKYSYFKNIQDIRL